MNVIDLFRVEQERLHNLLRLAVDGLSVEDWHFLLPGTTNHIAFLMLHIVRTEDNILRYILQNRRPPIWNEEGWAERLNLPPRVQGTGVSSEEAHNLHIDNPALFMEYAEKVWSEFQAYLQSIDDGGAELGSRIVKVVFVGEIPALQAIGQTCLTHAYQHYGEISLLRGALGMHGTPL